jgi:membrane protein
MLILLNPKTFALLCRDTALEWKQSNTFRMGASLAYYTTFAIAPLFVIALSISSLWFGEEAARHELFGQLQGLLGEQGGKAIESIVTAASSKPDTGSFATVLATITLILAATAVFVELQDALNTIWHVEREPGSGLKQFVKDRLLSFALVVGMGFLLMVSLVLSAALSAMGRYVSGMVGEHAVWAVVNYLISLGVITALFAMIYKFLPDVKIAWRDVMVGALLTALMFNLGKYLLGLYLGRSSVTSAYGAAGSLVVILMWVYYSAQILFFGAEFTRLYADTYGSHLQPVKGARLTGTKAERHPASSETVASKDE